MKNALDGLLTELGQAYELSDIKQICMDEKHEWHYSLLTTTMEKNGPLVIGFNWGVSLTERYPPQLAIEKSVFDAGDVGSLSRIFPYCEKYFGSEFLSKTSQSNYCFFRSKTEKQISPKDIALCEPIFEKLIAILKPSIILCFSSQLRDYLFANEKVASSLSKDIQLQRGATACTYKAIRATLKSGIEIKCLPHPNYPMKSRARAEAWEFCCGSSTA